MVNRCSHISFFDHGFGNDNRFARSVTNGQALERCQSAACITARTPCDELPVLRRKGDIDSGARQMIKPACNDFFHVFDRNWFKFQNGRARNKSFGQCGIRVLCGCTDKIGCPFLAYRQKIISLSRREPMNLVNEDEQGPHTGFVRELADLFDTSACRMKGTKILAEHVADSACYGGLSNAGRALKMDPATVGRRIQRLEEQLSTRLFVKSPQGYALSGAGQGLVEYADAAERAVLGALEETRDESRFLSGSIRIGAPDGVANYLLPQIVAEICDRHPGLEVQIVALPRVFNLSKREADMAITVSPPETGRLTVQKLTDYHLHLAASRAYLAAHPPIERLDDLKGHRLIGYIPDMIFDRELDYLNTLGENAQATLMSNSFSVQLNWARRGAGVCIVHDFAMPSYPDLVKLLVRDVALERSFYLIRHADDRRVARLNRFADLLAQAFRREVLRLEGLT